MQPFGAIHTFRDVAYRAALEQPVPLSHHRDNQENWFRYRKMPDEKIRTGKECLSLFPAISHTSSCCFWSSLCALFCHIHLPQPGVPSSLLQAPLSPCTSASEGMSLSLSCFCFWPLADLPHFHDLLSCFKWETSAFLSVMALAKLDTSILCLFTGQVQDRQQQSESSCAALHIPDLCNDPNFYGG